MTEEETRAVAREIRHLYYFIRTLRRGVNDAPRRRYYRKIAAQKKTPARGRHFNEGGAGLADVLPIRPVLFSSQTTRKVMG